MTVCVLGAGPVGRALATGFAERGHAVRLATRRPASPGHRAFARASGLAVTPYAGAAAAADCVVLATPWEGAEEALAAAAVPAATLVLDATNPPHGLADRRTSAGEQVQAWLPAAHVVKAFAMVGAGLMVAPTLPGGPPTMLIAGDDVRAKRGAARLLRTFGWDVEDLGGIAEARAIEALADVWSRLARQRGSDGHAFRLLRRP